MRFILLIPALLLAACSTTVPVTAKFPEAPTKTGATVPCPQLQKLDIDPNISQVSNTININYSTYYQCAVKLDVWLEWYETQKRIFEGVK